MQDEMKLYEIEDNINVLKSKKSELQSAMKLTQEEISRRNTMGMDATEFEKHLKDLDKKLVKVLKDIPKLETKFYNLKRNMDAVHKKEMLVKYIEARIRYYSNALDKVNGKKGVKLGAMFPSKGMEAQIAQYNRGN